MRPHKYHVELREEERKILEEIINKGKNSASKIKHAQILLKLDESNGKKAWMLSDTQNAKFQQPVESVENYQIFVQSNQNTKSSGEKKTRRFRL